MELSAIYEKCFVDNLEGNFPRSGVSGDNGLRRAVPVYPFGSLAFNASGDRAVNYPVVVAALVYPAAAGGVSGGYLTLEGYGAALYLQRVESADQPGIVSFGPLLRSGPVSGAYLDSAGGGIAAGNQDSFRHVPAGSSDHVGVPGSGHCVYHPQVYLVGGGGAAALHGQYLVLSANLRYHLHLSGQRLDPAGV